MASKLMPTVVTKKNDPTLVKLFTNSEEALAFTGPEYDKKGYIITSFEKKQETYFEPVEFDGMALDQTPSGIAQNGTEE